MINVSDLTGYLTCPRLCYFRMRFGTKLNEMNAVREIYLSLRKGYDLTWAENRFLELGGDKEVFKRRYLPKLSKRIQDELKDILD